MDPIFSFPVEDNGSLFQVGDGYDIPVADDLRFFSSENVVHEQVLLDVVDWGCISNFGLMDEVEAFIPNGNLQVGNMDGGENHDRDCWSTGGEDQVNMIKARRDRSKAIASERKRRSRMKEKLYELRSLVPNITKMDKASIIADAIVYLQNLQRQEEILVEEITVLESFSHEEASNHVALQKKEKRNGHRGEILGLIAHEVGEKRFLLKIEFCNRGDGASSSLCNAIETLECFKLESSIITCTSSRYICTLTFNCREMREEMNALALKYRVMDALLKKGFPFMTTAIY